MDRVPLFIGLDAGGSKTSLLAAAEGYEDLERTGPAANLQRAGLAATARVLADLVRAAADARPGAYVASVCAGVAGAGREGAGGRIADAVRAALGPSAPAGIAIVHDGEIALEGAFEGESGVMVIAGTGSLVLARDERGALHRVGGWGYLIGDEGSGHALGLGAVRAAAHAMDGGPATRLGDDLAEHFGLATRDDLIDAVYGDDFPVQRVAPLVLRAAEAGDGPARALLVEETSALVRQVTWLAARAADVRPRVALIGGLSGETTYRAAFFGELRKVLPDWRPQKPLHPPVAGALRLAQAAALNRRREA